MTASRLLVIGGGGDLGRRRILPALAELGVGADVVDLAPLVPQPDHVRQVFRSLSPLAGLVGRREYLGAVVATPNNLHLEHSHWAVAEAGLPCLTEKPIAHTLSAAKQAACLAGGPAPSWIADHYLAKPPSVYVIEHGSELLAAIGAPERIEGQIVEPAGTLSGRSWLLDPARSGGGIWLDTGVHLVTVLLALWPGLAWREVQARAADYELQQDKDVTTGHAETAFVLEALCHAPAGAQVKLAVGKAAQAPAKYLLLEGSRGSLRLDWSANTVTLNGDVILDAPDAPFGGYLALLGDFIQACRDRNTARCPALVRPGTALRALELIKSAYAASDLPPALRRACSR